MLSKKLALDAIKNSIAGKRVLMRVDFNVPIKNGKIKDATRITSTLPSIEAILKSGAKSLVLMSHLGRPDGQRVPKDSLKPLIPTIEQLTKKKVIFLEDCVGSEVEKACMNPKDGQIILLENLRFHPEEEGSSVINGKKVKAEKEGIKAFRESLTKLGDIYINDAFGTAHRAHSSMVGVNLPIKAAGYLLKKELDAFAAILENPKRPLTVILGGAKVADKIQLIDNMINIVDEMIIGGGMAFTFLKVLKNVNIAKSIFDPEGAKIVADIMKKAEARKVKIHLPLDVNCGDRREADACTKMVSISEGVPDGWLGLDCGPKTIALNNEVILRSKSILMNGPQGLFENPQFRRGSEEIIKSILAASSKGAITVAGGGDTVSLIQSIKGSFEKFTHVSTGGGASLELMEGKKLPGIVALSDS